MQEERGLEAPAAAGVAATLLTLVLIWEMPGGDFVGRSLQAGIAPPVAALVGAAVASSLLQGAALRDRLLLGLFAVLGGFLGAAAVELWWLHGACGGEACHMPVFRARVLGLLSLPCIPFATAGALLPPAAEARRAPASFPYWRALVVLLGFVSLAFAAIAAAVASLDLRGGHGELRDHTLALVAIAGLPAIVVAAFLRSSYKFGRPAPDQASP